MEITDYLRQHPEPGTEFRISRKGNALKVGEYIRDLVRYLADHDLVTAELANAVIEKMGGKNPVHDLGALIYALAWYSPDEFTQTLRTPQRLISDAQANCVDYTITLAAVGKLLNMNVILRIVKLPGHESYSHIYPVLNGIPVDLCIGQVGAHVLNERDPVPTIGLKATAIKEITIPV